MGQIDCSDSWIFIQRPLFQIRGVHEMDFSICRQNRFGCIGGDAGIFLQLLGSFFIISGTKMNVTVNGIKILKYPRFDPFAVISRQYAVWILVTLQNQRW